MKSQMFKIAGVNNEKDFYKKYPTEEAFMAKHGKTFKAQFGMGGGGSTGDILQGIGGMGGMMGNSGMDAGGAMGAMGGYVGMLNTVGEIGKGLKAIKAGKEAMKAAQQTQQVSSIALKASMTPDTDEQLQKSAIIQQRYNTQMRPVNGEELFPINGVGTNVLAKRGATIEKAQQGNIFSNGNFKQPGLREHGPFGIASPITTSETLGQKGMSYNEAMGSYDSDGMRETISSGPNQNFGDFMEGYGGAQVGRIAGNIMGNDGGSQLGGTLGKTAGTLIGGPIGGMVGEVAGKVIGGAIDTTDNRKKKANDLTAANMHRMANIGFGKSVHSDNQQFMQNGGDVQGASQDIQPMWGGGVKPLSYNPFTDGSGETMMFHGDSHKEGGIGVDYAGSKIEAEHGEPALKMQNGGDSENLVIYGDLPINEQTASMIGDPDSKGKKFKSYVNNIAKKENKVNKRKDSATLIAGGPLDKNYKFDRLKLDTQAFITQGSTQKLKQFAEKKENAAYAQNALNETAEEMGIDPVILAKGGDPMEKWLKRNMNKAKELTRIPDRQSAYAANGLTTTDETTGPPSASVKAFRNVHKNPNGLFGGMTQENYNKFKQSNQSWYDFSNYDPTSSKDNIDFANAANARFKNTYLKPDGKFGPQYASYTPGIQADSLTSLTGGAELVAPELNLNFGEDLQNLDAVQKPNEKWDPSGALSAISPLFGRGSDAEALDGNQLWGEMYAMSHNDVEPVYAQSYRPELDVPYDISHQDMLNRNTSTFRGAQKLSNGNPAALSMLAAQQYGADQPILAEQFRNNQAMKDRVYSGNRATLNDAKMKNMAIYDQQFVRQSQARSNTKQAHQLALNSISDKYAKNKLEQRTLKTYENLYNYRFGDDYVAHNVNDAINPDAMEENAWSGAGKGNSNTKILPEGYEYIYNKLGQPIDVRKIPRINKKPKQPELSTQGINGYSKYGSMTRALKKF